MSVQQEAAVRVLMVDDNVDLVQRALIHLTRAGYDVRVAYSGAEGLGVAFEFQPDIVVLDIMMEGMDGWEVCNRLRSCSNTLILFATAKNEEVDIVRGLDMGADGYITKGYTMDELQAHIEATLRRSRGEDIRTSRERRVRTDGYLSIDLDRNQVMIEGETVKMSPKEYQVLSYLVLAEGHLVRYVDLLENIWGEAYRADTTHLAIYISRLRQKIERDSRTPEYIVTRHKLGYEFQWPNGSIAIG